MDYQLKPLGKTCTATGQPLAPGSVCHSVVVERNGQFVRLDYSSGSWKGPPADAIGYWQTRVPEPKHAHHIDPDALMRYFEQLCEEGSPNQDVSRYVSALMLLKMKRLKLDDVRRDEDGEHLQLSGLRGEGAFEARHLQLPDDELAGLQQQLKAQLAGEWTA
jgi:hypothetical protein